ncbi:MAG: ribose-phosphate diphosphokinase [Nitrososphaerota archaeon]
MLIVPGPASKKLAEEISEITGFKLALIEHKLFPDGESYIRYLEKIYGEDIAIIQTTYPEQDRKLLQLFLLSKTAKEANCNNIIAIVPYLAYSRQDKAFKNGEAISIKVILSILKDCGINEVVTINTHSPWIFKEIDIKAKDLSAIPCLSKYLLSMNLNNPIIFSPGKKGSLMSKEAANIIGCDFSSVESKRNIDTGEVEVEIENVENIKNRDVIIIDDIISTGGTILSIIKKMLKFKPNRIIVGCIHPLLINNADKKILEAGAETIIATNTIETIYSKVSIAPLIADYLKNKLNV